MAKVHNYSAGPCILPQEVIKEAAEAVLNFDGLNLSILEISHRSPNFVAVMDEAVALVKELLEVPAGYSVCFAQGGASLGFLMAGYNMIGDHKKSAYLNTGTWSDKAIKEAHFFGDVDVIGSSKEDNYNHIPKGYTVPTDCDYLHYTSNNTIFGTQFKEVPNTTIPLVCDMSSDIFSKKVDISKFDLIYAGAQKNMGPAGATLYIIKDEVFTRNRIKIPTMLNIETHVKKDSMFNTPPVYPIYVSMLNLRYLKSIGGVPAQQKINEEKARILYAEIDSNPLFKGVAAVGDRSNMNATFVLTDESKQAKFDEMWKAANISGIKGHRSVGGYRASMYNALPVSSVQVLVGVMKALD
ncbi:3-phosphoserine/phosphohydroxythreonine transaminase [Flavobacteriales bacterium]|jgi:phosphoserine aminotransferase|nr:3-phosphoserine/phosphohydroxythreonine transaminase [Flavobacteriales bacterium]MDB9702217.1 3-phosphoserine/phosphohydroxythreonine transaminase [Flavobacteriales bacterium]